MNSAHVLAARDRKIELRAMEPVWGGAGPQKGVVPEHGGFVSEVSAGIESYAAWFSSAGVCSRSDEPPAMSFASDSG
jgi:hypothetical protein